MKVTDVNDINISYHVRNSCTMNHFQEVL